MRSGGETWRRGGSGSEGEDGSREASLWRVREARFQCDGQRAHLGVCLPFPHIYSGLDNAVYGLGVSATIPPFAIAWPTQADEDA